MDRLWSPNCLACTFTNLTPLDFLWDHIKSLVYKTPVDPEQDSLAQVMAAADVELQGIGDRVHVGTVYVLKSLVITLSPSCKWTQKNNVQ